MTTSQPIQSIEAVSAFWQANPCGNETSEAVDRATYFAEIERYRYASAPWIKQAAAFERFAGKRVLELGSGMGTDGAQFARAGATYVGVDLTNAAVRLARENFATRGLAGDFLAANAETLPFADDSFDHVYSFGVLHHTSLPTAAVDEIRRVLKPGATVTAMLYNRNSVNYYLEIQLLRRLGRALLRHRSAPRLLARTLGLSEEKLEGHRRQLLRIPHPTREQWISMNTDGPECPLARVYSAREAADLFSSFEQISTQVYFFDRTHWPVVGRLIGKRVANALGRRLGWNRMVYAIKPS